MKKYYFVIIIILVTIASLLSGAFGKTFQFIFVSLAYFYATYLIYKKDHNLTLKKVIYLILPFLLNHSYPLIDSIVRLNYFGPLLIFMTPIIGTFSFYVFKEKITIPFSITVLILGFIGVPNWYSIVNDTENPINQPFPELAINDITDKPFTFPENKVIVLDLWSTSCGVCIKKFPVYEALYLKYKNNNDVVFYTLNLPIKNDKNKAVKSYVNNYEFQSLFTKDSESWKKLENKSVPKFLILNKEKRIVYKGFLNDKWYYLYNNIDNLIEKHTAKI